MCIHHIYLSYVLEVLDNRAKNFPELLLPQDGGTYGVGMMLSHFTA